MDDKTRALWYENYRAALRDDCKAIADGSKAWAQVVGARLFPSITDQVAAGRRLNDLTNPNRDDRLTDDEERLIMRLAVEKRGFSAAHDFITDDIGMERGRPRERSDEALELMGRAERLMSEFKGVTERMERLASSPLALVSKKSAAA